MGYVEEDCPLAEYCENYPDECSKCIYFQLFRPNWKWRELVKKYNIDPVIFLR